MAIKILEKRENEVRFIIDKVSPALLNALRRAVSFEVPVMAIEDVYFSKNSSALYDEILALRLGLIPLITDLRTYNLPEECRCRGKGCGRCQAKAVLRVKGPATAYAKDLKFKGKVKSVFADMPIVKLLENQELELEAIAKLGRAKEHAKWAAGLAFYQRYPKIEINHRELKNPKVAINHCPKDVYDLKGSKLVIKNLLNCNLCKSCEDRTAKAIKISGEPNKYIFTLESWGQLSPQKVLAAAITIVKSKLKEVKLK